VIEIAAPFGARVLMSGDVKAAREAGTAGVHLARDGDPAAARRTLGPSALIGLSAHDLGEAQRATAGGADYVADYVTLSPVFASASKPGYGPPLGLRTLAEIAAAVALPVLALGGITAERVCDCLAAGAAGVAVMGQVMAAEDPAAVVGEFAGALHETLR
jgi:thiamine-phosphate pyrophosphorylase